MDHYFKNSILEHKPVVKKTPKSTTGSELASPKTIAAVAISGSNNSKNVIKWALKKFVSEKNVTFKLIHIHPNITALPTSSGDIVSISMAPEDVAESYRQQVLQETKETLLEPLKKMCELKKFAVELLVLESNDIVLAITKEVNQQLIKKLVIGRSSQGGVFSKNDDITTKISANLANLCTVYVVSKGVYTILKEKLSSSMERNETLKDSDFEITDSSSYSSDSGHISDAMSNSLKGDKRPTNLQTLLKGASASTKTSSAESNETRRMMYLDAAEEASNHKTSASVSWNGRFRDFDDRNYATSSISSNRDNEEYFVDNQNVLEEITKMRAELRRAQELYGMTQVENLDASNKLNDLNIKELTTNEHENKDVEKEKLEETSIAATPKLQYQEFTWEEIVTATSSFADDLKVGMGANGSVYKCNLHHTIAVVKVLNSAENSLSKQFNQEVEILSKIRHPHLVLLLGACPERGALVYEYMKNGSLEDRLFQVNNSQPIPWFVRFTIAWEVASALIFLHKSKPAPIIHRDLKPANILLDHNFVSKVGDVGLSTMIQTDTLSTKFTMYKQTSPVGTLCYIDPEYQRTGMISPKSDVYALGMVILQLLTAQPAIALTYTVEIAMENENDEGLTKILDQKAGDWPIEETRSLAALALNCTEIRAKDRPDLEDKILPALESLKKLADKARDWFSAMPNKHQTPSHFLCPLLKDVMKEPCIAADGYTYDRQAIEDWLESHRTSPVTDLPLQNNNLLSDHTLTAAIADWRRQNHSR